MKLHRVFIAVNLSDGVKSELLAYKEKWPELPVKWVEKENMHITLAFLGNMADREVAEVCELVQRVGERHTPFDLCISRIVYGPKQNQPRMIWALVEKSHNLLDLQHGIEKTLGQGSDKKFSPHLTLARLNVFDLQRMEQDEIPVVDESVSLRFQVESFEVVESELKRGGAVYTVLQSVPLGKSVL